MPKEITMRPGDLVDLFDEGGLVCAVVVAQEKGRLKVVTETGKELRVAASRIAHRAGHAVPSPVAAEAARRHAAAALERLEEIELAELWDVLVEETRRHTLGEMAALALGEDNPVTRSAMLRALQADRLYFTRKGDDHEPRSRAQVAETLKRETAERARAERREAFVALARGALAAPREKPPDSARQEWRPYEDLIADLVELAISGDEAPCRRQAVELLDDAGAPAGTTAERAFRLLSAMGLFGADENLFIHRFGLRVAFPPEVERAARDAAAAGPRDGRLERRELRELQAFSIDDEQTTEIDDAISLVERDGALALGVHIADPASFVLPGDPVDTEALSRSATFYFPDVKLPMMPAVLAEQAASLVPGQDRPALSFLVEFSPQGERLRWEIVPSWIRSRRRLTYEQADALLEDRPAGVEPVDRGDPAQSDSLRRLRDLCERLEKERVAAGAVVIRAPEVSIRVGPDGAVNIRRLDERGASRRIVAEVMILANRLAAEFCAQRSVPAIYRRQPPPAEDSPAAAAASPAGPETIPGPGGPDGYDPVAVRALRRRMRRGETGLAPAPHHGLGLDAYTQASSPIRRYQDLVVHRQIKAALSGAPLPYDAESLARIAATTEEAEKAAREAERGTDEYWILRHYETLAGGSVEGVIVAASPRRTEVELADTLYTATIATRPGHMPGRRIRLQIEESRPRAGRLTLREAPE